MTWSFFKAFFKNEPIRILMFSTFTTIISIVALRYSTLSAALENISLIGAEQLIAALVLFFISGVFWFASASLAYVFMPYKVRDFANREEYLERFAKGLSGKKDESTFDWSTGRIDEIKKWNEENRVGPIMRVALVIGLIACALTYVLALVVFAASVSEFVGQTLLHLFHEYIPPTAHLLIPIIENSSLQS